jgi:hypothetical protein
MGGLWSVGPGEYYRREFGKVQYLEKTVAMNADFGLYLLRNVDRFYMPEAVRVDQRTKEQKIQVTEAHIR